MINNGLQKEQFALVYDTPSHPHFEGVVLSGVEKAGWDADVTHDLRAVREALVERSVGALVVEVHPDTNPFQPTRSALTVIQAAKLAGVPQLIISGNLLAYRLCDPNEQARVIPGVNSSTSEEVAHWLASLHQV